MLLDKEIDYIFSSISPEEPPKVTICPSVLKQRLLGTCRKLLCSGKLAPHLAGKGYSTLSPVSQTWKPRGGLHNKLLKNHLISHQNEPAGTGFY